MSIKLHTCGNATLILEKNSNPILATDPWLDNHTAYFGSWCTSHKISKFHLDLLHKCKFYWISHFHPDHLNLRSLLTLKAKEKTILLSEQYYNRVASDLRKAGFTVLILPSRKFINIFQDLEIATFPILDTIDSALVIRNNQNLIVNLNDTHSEPSFKFLKKEIGKTKHSLLLKLAGYGDADMINIYNYKNNFLEPIAATKPAPGEILSTQASKINCTHAMHFSSFHKYIRSDSIWANKYTTPENDLKRGWDNKIGYFKQFSSIELTENGFKKIESDYPESNDMEVVLPEKYGDYWEQNPTERDIIEIKQYLNQIKKITKNSFSIKVGSKIIKPDKTEINESFIINAPRQSIIRAIRSNIFDDLLIGNFAKLILPSRKKINFRKSLKVATKYIDNAGIKEANELKDFLWNFRNSYDHKLVKYSSILKNNSRDFVISNLSENFKLLGVLKKIYQKI